MIPSTSRSALAFVSLGVMAVLLSGCTEQEVAKVAAALVLAVVVFLVVQLVIWAGLATILIVNLVRLGQGKPSLGWGITAIVAGAGSAIAGLPGLGLALHHGSLPAIALAVSLCYFGYKNVAGARELGRWKKIGDKER